MRPSTRLSSPPGNIDQVVAAHPEVDLDRIAEPVGETLWNSQCAPDPLDRTWDELARNASRRDRRASAGSRRRAGRPEPPNRQRAGSLVRLIATHAPSSSALPHQVVFERVQLVAPVAAIRREPGVQLGQFVGLDTVEPALSVGAHAAPGPLRAAVSGASRRPAGSSPSLRRRRLPAAPTLATGPGSSDDEARRWLRRRPYDRTSLHRNITVKKFNRRTLTGCGVWEAIARASRCVRPQGERSALTRRARPAYSGRGGTPMSPMARVRRELRFLRGLIRTLSRVRSIAPGLSAPHLRRPRGRRGCVPDAARDHARP